MSDQKLIALAKAAGLEPEWVTAAQEKRTVSPETLRTVLARLGIAAENARAIEESLRRLTAESAVLPRLIAAWAGDSVRLPPARHVQLYAESGEDVPVATHPHGIIAPAIPGYYRLEVDGTLHRLAVAPSRCFTIADISERKLAGVAVQLYALRGGHTPHFGDLAALGEFAHDAARCGIDAVLISPVHALFPANPAHASPYSPSTRLYFNPLFADIGLIGGGFGEDDGRDRLIDWGHDGAEKLAALRRAWLALPKEGAFPDAIRAFAKDGGEALASHAVFDVLDAKFRRTGIAQWHRWPAAFRDPRSGAVREFARTHREDVDFHIFLQWLTAKSLEAAQRSARDAGMAVGIIADVAAGMDPNGSHAWCAADDVLNGLRIGAPPDIFNPHGQNWGLTNLLPSAMHAPGFAAFIATLRASMRFAGGMRIDHVMALKHLWVVPDGAPPDKGVYLEYPMEDLLRIIALESHRHRAIVIGEDLGTVPDGFQEALAKRGIDGMQVLWFEREKGEFLRPDAWRRQAAAMTTTHDLPTAAGWWRGRDIDWLEKLGRKSRYPNPEAERRARDEDRRHLWSALEDAGCVSGEAPLPEDSDPVVDGVLCFAGKTPSELAIAEIEDVLGLAEQPNLPGTIDEHPNWRRRLPPGDLLENESVQRRLMAFAGERRDVS